MYRIEDESIQLLYRPPCPEQKNALFAGDDADAEN